MEDNVVLIKRYNANDEGLAYNDGEAFRYAGYGNRATGDAEFLSLYEEVKKQVHTGFEYKVCYRHMELEIKEDEIVLPFSCKSENLIKLLRNSREVIIFAASVGHSIDRSIAGYKISEPTKALIAQGIGAERVETLCNLFCRDMAKELAASGRTLTPRFSPGYGDMKLEHQKDFFRCLDCERQVGIFLNDSLLMTPSKSVTAIMGVEEINERT